jgi:hypothetical protein
LKELFMPGGPCLSLETLLYLEILIASRCESCFKSGMDWRVVS